MYRKSNRGNCLLQQASNAAYKMTCENKHILFSPANEMQNNRTYY